MAAPCSDYTQQRKYIDSVPISENDIYLVQSGNLAFGSNPVGSAWGSK